MDQIDVPHVTVWGLGLLFCGLFWLGVVKAAFALTNDWFAVGVAIGGVLVLFALVGLALRGGRQA